MSGSLIFVNYAFISHAIDNRHCGLVSFVGLGVIAAVDSSDDFLDAGAYHGSETGVVTTTTFALSGTLAGLWRISQVLLLLLCLLNDKLNCLGSDAPKPEI